MAKMQTPEALAAPGSCEKESLARLEVSTNTPNADTAQAHHLIAVVAKSARESIHVVVRPFNGTRKVELRIFEKNRLGIDRPTPRALVLPPASIRGVIDALREAGEVLA